MDAEVLASLDGDGLDQLTSKVVGAQAGLMAEACALVLEADRREVWRSDGCTALSGWVAERFSIPIGEARRLCRTARALTALPLVFRALGDGVLSWDKVVAVVEIIGERHHLESVWIETAVGSSVEHLQAVARRLRKERRDAQVGDGDGRNHLHLRADPEHGSVRFWGTLVGDDAARFQTAIDHTAKNEMRAVAGESLEAWDIRCGDALAVVTSAHLGGVSRDRATVNVHLDADAAATNAASGEASMKPPFDYPVSTSLLERLLCDCRLRVVIDGPDGSVLRFSDAEHPPPALEQAVYRRDAHCVIKGCRATHGEIHHLVWRSKGGPTVMENLVFVCWRHHRMIHHHGWSLTGTARALEWARPDGSIVWSTGPPKLAA